jgi:hypothetical protein
MGLLFISQMRYDMKSHVGMVLTAETEELRQKPAPVRDVFEVAAALGGNDLLPSL